jgi:hypothetical protein
MAGPGISDDGKGLRPPPPWASTAVIVSILAVMVVFQTAQLTRERDSLNTILSNQETPLQDAAKLRVQLEGIAGDTALLAQQGNPHALAIQQQLARSGITIRPPSAAQGPAAPAPQR